MTDQTEPTVQVPVSLIKLAVHHLARGGFRALAGQLQDALLSQPTPTAASLREHAVQQFLALATCPDDRSRLDRLAQALDTARSVGMTYAPTTAEPPRIEDMAPGTTFTFTRVDGARVRGFVMDEHITIDVEGSAWRPNEIDPSTIRDVTPPAVTE